MNVRNYLRISNEEFLQRSITRWQAALAQNNMSMFEYWAMHAVGFAQHVRAAK